MKTATPEKNGLVDRSGTDLMFAGMALDLERAVRGIKKLYVKTDPEFWAKQFAILHAAGGVAIPEINTVLAWYIRNISKPYVPQAYSAGGFRKKFRQIKQAMKRAAGETAVTQTIRAFRAGLGLVWPRDDDRANELAFLQLTSDRYMIYLGQLKRVQENERMHEEDRKREQKKRLGVVTSSTDELAGLAAYVFALAPPVADFVEAWARRVNRLATVWDKWPGELLKFAWHRGNPFWEKQMRRICDEYCGAQNDGWGKILSHLG
jgi:hypothetical protein